MPIRGTWDPTPTAPRFSLWFCGLKAGTLLLGSFWHVELRICIDDQVHVNRSSARHSAAADGTDGANASASWICRPETLRWRPVMSRFFLFAALGFFLFAALACACYAFVGRPGEAKHAETPQATYIKVEVRGILRVTEAFRRNPELESAGGAILADALPASLTGATITFD